MCKKREMQEACLSKVYARCADEIVSKVFFLFTNRDEMDDLMSIVTVLKGGEANEFLTHSDGTVTFGDGPYPASNAGKRGIGRMFDADKVMTLHEFYAMA